jgi:hypothetical protein
MAPVAEFSDKPPGKKPVKEKEYGLAPPVVFNTALYGTPTVA